MKFIYLFVFLVILDANALGQFPPTWTSPLNSGQSSQDYWSRAGNNTFSNNIFGLKVNSPLYTVTGSDFPSGNTYRSKLNGSFDASTQYSINGYGFGNTNQQINTTGYLLLGNIGSSLSDGQSIYLNKGAFSLLHLNGYSSNGTYQESGFRSWMKTGITLTGNNDLSYFGQRALGSGDDVTETTLAWADNAGNGGPGPDDFAFRFISGAASNSFSSDYSKSDDTDGLHVARLNGTGLMGLGNTFGTNIDVPNSIAYNDPKSLMHLSYQFRTGTTYSPFGFLQVTYRRPYNALADIVGQGENFNDGLRIGIDNNIVNVNTSMQHLNGYLRWQEASSFIIQTEDNLAPNIEQNERMRITSTGALDLNYGTSYQGIDTPSNRSRIALSLDGSKPITKPLSLLHLGYNTGGIQGISTLQNQLDGWRPWMELGMFTSNQTDHVFIGLKPENGINIQGVNDRMDAVVGWGDNGDVTSLIGPSNAPDVMRFIFTAFQGTAASPNITDSPQAVSNNGLEVMRLYPERDTTNGLFGLTYGRVGIGDFSDQGVNEQPTHKLDVIGNARLRGLPDSIYFAHEALDKVVMVDNDGVLHWRSQPISSFGAECGDNENGVLTFETKVDLNNHNLYFTRNDETHTNKVGIGYNCGDGLEGKLSVYSKNETWSGDFYVDGNSPIDVNAENHQGGIRSIIDSTSTYNATAIYGYVEPNWNAEMESQVGLKGEVLGKKTKESVGVYGISRVLDSGSGAIGGRFLSTGGSASRAVQAQNSTHSINQEPYTGFGFGGDFSCESAQSLSVFRNVGIKGSAHGSSKENVGVEGKASGSDGNDIGIYGWVDNPDDDWAGYFEGKVYISGTYGPSDFYLKENINSLEGADSILTLLNPVAFDFRTEEFPQLNLQEERQMGLIAQEVEQIIPEIVKENSSIPQFDSLGNLSMPVVTFKTLDYTKLIPLLIAGHKEQQQEIASQDTVIQHLSENIAVQQQTIDNLNLRLQQLESCLTGILPLLCQLNQSAITTTSPQELEGIRKQLSIEISNRNSIVLDQNVPNPFAEQTVINFSIPETVQKAQIHFYYSNGQLIQSIELVERGLGSLTVFGSNLSSGAYTYTLVADGAVVASKKMLKQ